MKNKPDLRSSTSVADLKDKLSQAVSGGFMNKNISDLLIDGLDDQTVMATVQAVSPDTLDTEEAILLTFILDESSSMSPHRDLVVAALKSIITDLQGYKQSDAILVSGWTFNTQHQLMFAHKKIADVTDDFDAYSPSGMTAEYDAVKSALTSARAYAQDLMDNGYRVRLITVVFTDGEDNSSRATTAEVKNLSQALTQEEIAVLALVGFKGYDQFSPQKMAGDIGFPNVLELDFKDDTAVHASIKKMTGMLSASVIRASQTTVAASQNSFFS